MKALAMNVAGAIVAPLAMLANEVLPHPIVPHAIAAPRRVLCSSSLGRISYYEDGEASGFPILILHDVAFPGSATALRALFEELRGERPIVVPDLLGHGFSEKRRTPFTREEHVQFVDEIVADVSRRYGTAIDVVAVGASCELVAASIVASSRHVRSLALVAPVAFDASLRSRLVARVQQALGMDDSSAAGDAYDEVRVPTRFVAEAAADATADLLRAFWRTRAVKPELRLIRGEKSERGAIPIHRGSGPSARRRSWT